VRQLFCQGRGEPRGELLQEHAFFRAPFGLCWDSHRNSCSVSDFSGWIDSAVVKQIHAEEDLQFTGPEAADLSARCVAGVEASKESAHGRHRANLRSIRVGVLHASRAETSRVLGMCAGGEFALEFGRKYKGAIGVSSPPGFVFGGSRVWVLFGWHCSHPLRRHSRNTCVEVRLPRPTQEAFKLALSSELTS